jgi:hypothetical protein
MIAPGLHQKGLKIACLECVLFIVNIIISGKIALPGREERTSREGKPTKPFLLSSFNFL